MKHKRAGSLPSAAATSLAAPASAAVFGEDLAFLKGHTEVVVLTDTASQAQVAVVPAWQGRVMTSTSGGQGGLSYGWINRELIASRKFLPQISPFGGEDRFWMGPEGGQFSIFFAKGASFDFANWFTPPPLDTMPFAVVSRAADAVVLEAKFTLKNYTGTSFDVAVQRGVRLLDAAAAWRHLGVASAQDVSVVGFESDNRITNTGSHPWRRESGLLSIWILGMMNPSPSTTIIVPIKPGPEAEMGVKVTSDYFGAIPAERFAVKGEAVFLAADGKFRSKIGINPKRSRGILGSYDADHGVLTLVQYTQPAGVTEYVNSQWKLQDDPFGGDTANAYNDGPVTPGAKPMGPFYELESSSPAAALAPGQSLAHLHRTVHLRGPESALDPIARATLGVSLAEIRRAF